MNEAIRTSIYVGVALVVAGAAWLTRPQSIEYSPHEQIGKPLFADFKQPGQAASLEVVRFVSDLGELHNFRVAKDKDTGLWVIPSHDNYPADAENQMRDTATQFIDLQVLDIASEVRNDHVLYGVVEPDKENLAAGQQGVGMLLGIRDAQGKNLGRLIVGQKVKGADNQRFARIPGHDPVYVVELETEKFSTRFEDWIEKDLLKLNAWDIERVTLKDYSVVQQGPQQFLIDPRLEMTALWDGDDNQWNLKEMLGFNGRQPVPLELGEQEELNTQRLDDLKQAIDDLKIVGVRRKPEGLGANLKADQGFLNDGESLQSLRQRGFYLLRGPEDDEPELLSANGEVHVGMQDGVEYVLRFGEIAGTEAESEDGTMTRFLFVTARVDQTKLARPELQPLPEAPATPAGDAQDEAAEGEAGEAQAADEQPAESEAEESGPAEGEAEESEGSEAEQPEQQPAEEEDPAEALEAERERIAKENQRKLDQWKEDQQKAANRAAELNARFGDWYYVISEDVYKKVHLSRADLIQEGELAKEEGFGVDAFRSLELDEIDDELE